MSGDRVSKVLAGPVCIRGIRVGEPLDVFFDSDLRSAIGLEVLCRDGIRRFLPWAVAKSGPDGLSISFSLALLDGPQLEYYREHALTLSLLRRLPFESSEGRFGVEDVVVGGGGRILALLVEHADRQLWIERQDLVLEPDRLLHVNGRRRHAEERVAGGAA